MMYGRRITIDKISYWKDRRPDSLLYNAAFHPTITINDCLRDDSTSFYEFAGNEYYKYNNITYSRGQRRRPKKISLYADKKESMTRLFNIFFEKKA